MARAFGIVTSSGSHVNVGEMQNYRPVGAVSFLGRYRVIVGLGLHLFNFWAKMQLPELMHNMGMHADTLTLAYAANGAYHIQQTFSSPVYVVLYLVWLFALWFHLTHGFWSSMQSLGWNNKVWINRWKCISNIYSTIVVLGFALVVVVFFVKTLICGGAC